MRINRTARQTAIDMDAYAHAAKDAGRWSKIIQFAYRIKKKERKIMVQAMKHHYLFAAHTMTRTRSSSQYNDNNKTI